MKLEKLTIAKSVAWFAMLFVAPFAFATSNYSYKLDEYAVIERGLAPNKAYAIAAHQEGAYKRSARAVCEFTEPFYTMTVDFKARTLTVSSFGDFEIGATSKRTDFFKDVSITDDGHGNLVVAYAPQFGAERKPIELLRIITAQKGSDGMSDREYAAAADSFLHGKVEHGGCNFVQ